MLFPPERPLSWLSREQMQNMVHEVDRDTKDQMHKYRSDRELLEDILEMIRQQNRVVEQLMQQVFELEDAQQKK